MDRNDMNPDRRALIGGMTGAAMLAPFLALERAAAEVRATPAHAAIMRDEAHLRSMRAVLGPGMTGTERVGMLIYPGFTALDLVGPHYFFACMFGATVELVSTTSTLAPVASDLKLAIAPTVTLTDAAKDYDILFVPGGTEGTMAVMRDARAIAWLADRAARARWITSVCTGSMILGKAGLLKGKRATSHWIARPVLPRFGAIEVDARVVTDGKIITGAGVSAGLDFGIAIVAALRGRAYAEALMLQAEYHPEPPFPGGTLATTPPAVGAMMHAMFKPLEAQFAALAV